MKSAMAPALLAIAPLFGQIYSVGPGISPPRVVSKSEPSYTEEARIAKVNSMALLSLVVREDGTVEDVRVTRGAGFGLDDLAVQSVERWHFEPGKKEGQPVKVRA